MCRWMKSIRRWMDCGMKQMHEILNCNERQCLFALIFEVYRRKNSWNIHNFLRIEAIITNAVIGNVRRSYLMTRKQQIWKKRIELNRLERLQTNVCVRKCAENEKFHQFYPHRSWLMHILSHTQCAMLTILKIGWHGIWNTQSYLRRPIIETWIQFVRSQWEITWIAKMCKHWRFTSWFRMLAFSHNQRLARNSWTHLMRAALFIYLSENSNSSHRNHFCSIQFSTAKVNICFCFAVCVSISLAISFNFVCDRFKNNRNVYYFFRGKCGVRANHLADK